MAMASAPLAAPERIALSPDAETQWVPFDLTPGNQIRFAMRIDGHSADAILDTGVSVSVLSRRWTDRNAIRVEPGSHALGIGGNVAVGWIAGRQLEMGGWLRSGGRLGVVDLPASVTGGARAIDALIGRDLLDRYALDIDFAGRRFRLLPSGRLPFAGQSAPLAILPRQNLYISEARIGDTRLRPMIVDTGDGASLTVSQDAWRALKVSEPATTTISYGMSGPVTTELAVLPAVEIGEATLHQAEARVEPDGGFSTQVGAAGRIGLGFLQRYRVLLDPGAGRMVLAPNPAIAQTPTQRSTSGLLFSVSSDRLNVLHVMRGGPAAASGWQVGDQICSIDGAPVDSGYARQPIALWPIGTPGRVVALGMCGGGTRSLTLRRFY